MTNYQRLFNWLETQWVAPAYAGGLLIGIALCFFGAAINTMAGWLYAISGLMLALCLVAAVVPPRSLRGISVKREPIRPVSVGDSLQIELMLHNATAQAKTLIQVQDDLPEPLQQERAQTAIESILPGATHRWVYRYPAGQRGVYHWQTVQLRTAAPLGLFWCRRRRSAPAKAVVYPTVLNLSRCPLIDETSQDRSQQNLRDRTAQAATEGLTRALRPYRWGDSIRLIHWRTSARYGELRVRELERWTSGQEIVVGLDSAADWSPAAFEQAVIAAASLYFYALKQGLQPCLWTAATGLVERDRTVLETLAAVQFGETPSETLQPDLPFVWLTSDRHSITALSNQSRWLLWPSPVQPQTNSISSLVIAGLEIQPEQPLLLQLQAAISTKR